MRSRRSRRLLIKRPDVNRNQSLFLENHVCFFIHGMHHAIFLGAVPVTCKSTPPTMQNDPERWALYWAGAPFFLDRFRFTNVTKYTYTIFKFRFTCTYIYILYIRKHSRFVGEGFWWCLIQEPDIKPTIWMGRSRGWHSDGRATAQRIFRQGTSRWSWSHCPLDWEWVNSNPQHPTTRCGWPSKLTGFFGVRMVYHGIS